MIERLIDREWRGTGAQTWIRAVRWQFHLLVGLEALLFLYLGVRHHFGQMSLPSDAVAYFFLLFSAQAFIAMAVFAPVVGSTSLTREKESRTLELMFTTPLWSTHILFGKLLANLCLMLYLVSPGVPMIFIFAAILGLSGLEIGLMAAEAFALALFLTALSLLASTVCRKSTSAVSTTYGLAALVQLFAIHMHGTSLVSLFTLSKRLLGQTILVGEQMTLLGACLAGTIVCFALATLRLRSCLYRHVRPPRRKGVWWARPRVGKNPLRWKERHMADLGALSLVRYFPAWLRWGALAICAAAVLYAANAEAPLVILATPLIVGMLACARGATLITREKEIGAWEMLKLTGLYPSNVIRGKVWGLIDSHRKPMLAVLVGGVIGLLARPMWPETVANLAAFGVSWAVCWPMLYYASSLGIRMSATVSASWMAQIAALAQLLAEIFLLHIACTIIFSVASLILFILLETLTGLAIAMSLAASLAVTFYTTIGGCLLWVWLLPRAEWYLEKAEEEVTEAFNPKPTFPRWGRPRRQSRREVQLQIGLESEWSGLA